MSSRRDAQICALAGAISALMSNDEATASTLLRGVLSELQPQQSTLPGMPAVEPDVGRDEVRKQAALRVIAYWKQRCGHAQAKPTPERARCVIARLREGYSEQEIRKAIDGASVAAYVNEDGHKYDDLTLICRNGSKLESFIERGVRATGDIEVAVGDGTSDEEKIAQLRRDMAALKKAGRDTEYQHAASELQQLMARRAK
jgi:hypothetical protein